MTEQPRGDRRARANAAARSQALQHEIMELIIERGIGPGEPLPTEQELVEELGVGRNTVREALKVLQAVGVVDVRHGYGMFVARKKLDGMRTPLEFHARLSLTRSGQEAMELVDVRQALEAGLIGPAIDAITAEDLAEVLSAVEEMERLASAGLPLVEADERFHGSLYASLDNGLLSNLLGVFWSAYSRLHAQIGPATVDLGETALEHRRIYEAVVAQDAARARELLTSHFDGIRRLIQAVVGESAPA
ncbi:FadR/GntR family transcriptional regulator [Zhihengliuella salsuginis]|uniref:Transcriptional regulator n=1 Tax=Zhihengliuella salsuginis TaxID=578222 RepID=A0ABQ3GHC9_9MICC|nr:FadR/GntR family transcriptional regulator [Zhihengliuella salsuginis]GHD04429.1 transcriptional regulator [Zhihengliuella salsuginis]